MCGDENESFGVFVSEGSTVCVCVCVCDLLCAIMGDGWISLCCVSHQAQIDTSHSCMLSLSVH